MLFETLYKERKMNHQQKYELAKYAVAGMSAVPGAGAGAELGALGVPMDDFAAGGGMGAAIGLGGYPLELLHAKRFQEAQRVRKDALGIQGDPVLKGITDKDPGIQKLIDEKTKTIEELKPQLSPEFQDLIPRPKGVTG